MRERTVTPIGVIHTPHSVSKDTPNQPSRARGIPGRVEVLPEFEEGLDGVERFPYVYLIFAFDRVDETRLTVVPHSGDGPRGVFSTRSPRRPNSIGVSLVRLVGREGRVLHVEDVDMLDGTPLLDIKPYVADIDSR